MIRALAPASRRRVAAVYRTGDTAASRA